LQQSAAKFFVFERQMLLIGYRFKVYTSNDSPRLTAQNELRES
jgi:hypothetical protein